MNKLSYRKITEILRDKPIVLAIVKCEIVPSWMLALNVKIGDEFYLLDNSTIVPVNSLCETSLALEKDRDIKSFTFVEYRQINAKWSERPSSIRYY